MRTALFLLLLLSIAAVPGSIFPQRSIDAAKVADFIATNPTTGPWLDRLGFFEVYSSVWFSAIYLLLVISLVGCIVPGADCTGTPSARSHRAPRATSRGSTSTSSSRTPATWNPRGRPPRKRCGAGDFGWSPTTTSR
jgi:cytochrome c biogenesis protein